MEAEKETERRTHAPGLVFPPAGPDHDYTGMQLPFIGSIAEYAARHDYDLLLSPARRRATPRSGGWSATGGWTA
jgi:hypothetical protein